MRNSGELDRIIARQRQRRDAAQAHAELCRENLARTKAEAEGWLQAQAVLQAAAQATQTAVHGRIAGLVERCLNAVFPDPCGFDIRFEQKRGKTEAKLVFTKGGHEIDPTEAGSGGMLDVTALAMRLACLKLHQPRLRQVLLLDEPMRFVGAENLEAVAELIETLAEETGMQFILVSHHAALKIGNVVEL